MNDTLRLATAIDTLIHEIGGMPPMSEKRAALLGLSAILKALAINAARRSVTTKPTSDYFEEDDDFGIPTTADDESLSDRILREQLLGIYDHHTPKFDDLTEILGEPESYDALGSMFENSIDTSGTSLDISSIDGLGTHLEMD